MTKRTRIVIRERNHRPLGALVLGAGLAFLLGNPAAGAEETEAAAEPAEVDYSRTGPYTAVSGAFSPQYKGTAVGGLNARAGYRFKQFLATEVEFEWLNVTSMNRTVGPDFSIDSYTVTANLKVYPNYRGTQFSFFDNRLQPFFNLGGGILWIDPQKDNEPGDSLLGHRIRFAARLGAGAEYYATENLVIVAEGAWKAGIRSAKNVKTDVDYGSFTLGLQYRF